jgi:hypothetical protein
METFLPSRTVLTSGPPSSFLHAASWIVPAAGFNTIKSRAAVEVRAVRERGGWSKEGRGKCPPHETLERASSSSPSLPLFDELRTFCYEHQIEEIRTPLADVVDV